MIGLAGEMFLGHPADDSGVEDAGGGHMGRLGEVESPAFQILL